MDTQKAYPSLLHSFIEHLPDGVMIVDRAGTILDLNRNVAFLLNIAHDNPINLTYGELVGAATKEAIDALTGDIRSMGFGVERELTLSFDSVDIAVSLSGFQLFSEEPGAEPWIGVICREMSARQEIDRMHDLETLKSDFVSSITHDLKAPLTSIVGYSDLLLDTAGDTFGAEETDILQIIRREGLRLTRMVNDILDVTRIEFGRVPLKSERTELKDVIDEVLKIAGVKRDSFICEREIDERIPPLFLDRELITRVFINLVSNAVKYSPDGVRLKIHGHLSGDNVQVDVSDHGIGMSDESLSHLFEKFFRVKSDQNKGISGTGLGLVITKGFVEAHGGRITVTSQPGEGTTFSVILPLQLADYGPALPVGT